MGPVDVLLRSTAVYDAVAGTSRPGHVAVAGDTIVSVGPGNGAELVGPRTAVHELGDGLVTPAFHDNHTFLTATLLDHAGADGGGLGSLEQVVAALATLPRTGVLVARDVDLPDTPRDLVGAALDQAFPDDPVVVVGRGRAWLVPNSPATRRFGDLDPASNESLAPLYAALAEDAALVEKVYRAAAAELGARGVVSVKEIAFDDYLGVLPVLERLTADGGFPLRISVASQPVRARADLEFAEAMRRTHTSPALRFHGFKLMTDGSFDEFGAHLLGPDDEWTRLQRWHVDYGHVEDETRRILRAGHAVALNADGDGAVHRCLDVLETAREDGIPIPAGTSLSDVSLVSDQDAVRAGRLGLFCEVYPQLLLIEGYTTDLVRSILGPEREQRLGNFAALTRAGACLAAGTDLPLFLPSVPEALLSTAERRFPDGGPEGGWHAERALSRAQVLDSWTIGGARATGAAGWTGTLEVGKRADIAAHDRDLLDVPVEELAGASVVLTLAGGAVVHRR
ncbi:hypothetical protein SAMN05660690_2970 [Geodermatophilus telluris]|uniref:Amidohydrolase 3 domain-containing protein n=1 Tax=Geodermatophilus telluris TaxID=1190417 RepID=A0A1G6QM98_9ACTN|nr:amidohydrolase family protein [Geodermatophilus telluris]SDC92795.1 hypothetical protein SAMN05660690_2970 [Geodermatophilus telluris]